MVPELVHKFPAVYESRSSLPCSQDFAIVPVVCKVNPVHTLPSYFFKDTVCYCPLVSPEVFEVVIFLQTFSPKLLVLLIWRVQLLILTLYG
jgi:hypothetical protein